MNKRSVFTAVTLIIAALLVPAVLMMIFSAVSEKEITGTFRAGEEVSPDCIYITFYRDDNCLVYRQFETGIAGRYTIDELRGGSAVELELADGSLLAADFDGRDTLTFTEEFIEDVPCPVEFRRISGTPMEINVPGGP